MDKGTKVFRAYVCMNGTDYWLDKGTISSIVVDGKPLVQWADSLVPFSDKWHETEAEAKADVARELAVDIGRRQAVLDKLRDEILHESLAAEAA